MLIGLELRHAQEIMQHVQLVSLGELAQRGCLLGDEGNRLICPASPGSSLRGPSCTPDAARARLFPGFVTRPHPNPCPAETLRRHGPQLQGGILQLSRYETFLIRGPFNTLRFDSEGLTTHVRVETADPNLNDFGPIFSRKLLELHEYRHCGVAGESQDD